MTAFAPSATPPAGATMSGVGDEAAELERRISDALMAWSQQQGPAGFHPVCEQLADELQTHAEAIARFLVNENTVTEYIDGLVEAARERAEQEAVWNEDRRWLDQGEE